MKRLVNHGVEYTAPPTCRHVSPVLPYVTPIEVLPAPWALSSARLPDQSQPRPLAGTTAQHGVSALAPAMLWLHTSPHTKLVRRHVEIVG